MTQSAGKHVRGDRAILAEHLHGAANDLRQDDPAVPPGAHERRLGDSGADFALGETLGQQGDGLRHASHGKGEVGPRIAVGHRIDVEIVDLLFALLEGRKPGGQQLAGPCDG